MKKLAIYLIFGLLVFSGCKKDNNEDELSREELLCNKWKIEKYEINDMLAEYMTAYSWKFVADGTLEIQEVDTQFPEILYAKTEWRWVNNGEKIEIKALDNNDKDFYTKDEFILCDIKTLTGKSLST